jgi:AraC-like DNA-binding protein
MIDIFSVYDNKVDKRLVNMKLYVRYMVCLRCKKIVKDELKKLEIKHTILPYGAIVFHGELTKKKIIALKGNLRKSGLDLLNVRESKLVDRIITTIIEVIHSFDELPKLSYKEVICNNAGDLNESVFKIFSEVVGMSVVQFIVLQKIERIKELLLYDDLSLTEIADMLNYQNKQKLTAQFKKYTGLNPEYFLELKKERRIIASQSSRKPLQKSAKFKYQN